MKRSTLYRIGKAMDWLGDLCRKVPNPGEILRDRGLTMWDGNCDCEKCLDRRARYAQQDEDQFFRELARALAKRTVVPNNLRRVK